MFDIMIEKAKQKMFGRLESELDDAEQRGESRKVESFLIRVLPNIFTSVMIFLGLLYIFMKIHDKYGFDRVIIGIGVIIILSLRSILKTLNKVSES